VEIIQYEIFFVKSAVTDVVTERNISGYIR